MPNPLTQTQVDSIVSVVYKARTDQQVKLRFGLRKRSSLLETIRDGTIDKTDYRYKWLTSTRNSVIEFLGNEAKKFGVEFPHDAISVHDLIDVAESVVFLLKNHTNDS